jgi:negative regulator of sigma-B (phosphoserine phosphatase)
MLRDLAHCTRPCTGESANGDGVLVRREGDRTLLAVIDALGHGPGAAESAMRAMHVMERGELPEDLLTIVQSVHAALRGLRGAVMTALLVTPERMSGCAVGNVSMKALGAELNLLMSPGVLGGQVRKFRLAEWQRPPRGRIALFSDGISQRLSLEATRDKPAALACQTLFAEHAKGSDDATLLIVDL